MANEAGIEGRYIGRIDIRGDHSTVDLPSGMPKEIFQHLKRVYVRGQSLRITALGSGDQRPARHFKAREQDFGDRRPGPRPPQGGRFDDRGPSKPRRNERGLPQRPFSKDRNPKDS
ncbi:MAG: DbpA RNA binding domain-containing protein [Thiohalocapsa sp.]